MVMIQKYVENNVCREKDLQRSKTDQTGDEVACITLAAKKKTKKTST
jgi:hypothetical protein